MSSIIDEVWGFLYSMNPKIQAFGVCKDSTVIWQTSNWNLVNDVESIINAPSTASPSIVVNGTTYSRVSSSSDTYAGTSTKQDGHILISRISGNAWVVGWAEPSSDPELAVIDIEYTARKLDGQL